ncbi:MAG: vitamin B12 dependent methionine synthase [Eggerthellaceae bacterium]
MTVPSDSDCATAPSDSKRVTALPYSKRTTLSVSVNHAEALRYLGHNGQDLTPDLQKRLTSNAEACQTAAKPAACWATFAIDTEASRWLGANEKHPVVVLQPGPLGQKPPDLEGASINQHLRGATHVVLMAVTLGLRSEAGLVQLNASSPTDALLYSASGSSLVEEAADAAEALIREQAAQAGLYENWRFSPGYGDLPLSAQPTFLACLDATRSLGITATDTNLLIPTKSVTAVLGLFDHEPPDNPPNPCDDCLIRHNCPFKKKGITCHGQ